MELDGFSGPCSRNAQDLESVALHYSAPGSSERKMADDTDTGSEGCVEKHVEASMEPESQESRLFEYHGGLTDSGGKAADCDDLLKAEKKRLLAELELGVIVGGITQVQKITEPDCNKIGYSQGFCEQASQVQIVHDGVLIESVPGNPVGNGYSKEAGAQDYSMERDCKQEPRRKEKRSRRRGKTVNEDPERTEWNTDIASVTKYPKKEGEPRRVYSRKELEVLRYFKVADQKKLWKDVYKGLSAEVRQKYDGLAISKRCGNINLKFDSKASLAIGKNVSKEPENVENCETANIDIYNQAGSHTMNEEEELHEDDDSDDEYNSILRPAFLVQGEPDFDSGPPEDGFEYLRRVRWEAALIPKVKVAKFEKSKMNTEQSIYMPQIPEIAMCSDHLLPTKEWEDNFLSNFSELRQALSDLEDQSTGSSSRVSPEVSVWGPNNSWQSQEAFFSEKFDKLITGETCTGEMKSDDQSTVTSPCGGSESSETPVTQSLGELPSLSDIQRMGAAGRVSMLRKRISSFEEKSAPSRCEYVWLFALCAAVDTPLDADSCASLRSLLRKCAALRASKSEVDDEAAMLNILATIAGRYFGQLER